MIRQVIAGTKTSKSVITETSITLFLNVVQNLEISALGCDLIPFDRIDVLKWSLITNV